ncbi:hypothetical protein L9F63_024801 [Diploptera punctata]|uniref:GRIP1-associated protein 1 n=1 Tax=Diploptera punctata TaxID=6984 RepID=A0AAD7ZEA8_DIPPU|nr:hypothetical protein L9F63_024801 [Diploptera punctata]
MASQLSDEEFHRLQTQLIELRTANYGLEEQCRKFKIDNEKLMETVAGLEREYQKLQKTFNRSKKAKDVDLLINKNENLQEKLEAQEEEFRLQSQTLMQELSTLVAANEKLENELNALKKQGSSSSQIKETQPGMLSEQELEELREAIQLFSVSDHDDSIVSSDGDFVQVGESDVTYQKHNKSHSDIFRQAQEKLQHLEAHHKNYIDTVARLEAEQEERQGIQVELQEVKEKLRRKQESLMQLQEEKEKLYVESRKSYEELQVSKDQESASLRDHNQRLQVQLNNALTSMQEFKEKSAKRIQELELQISQATKKNDSKTEERKLEMQAKSIELECLLGETRQELESIRQQKLQLEQQLESLQANLTEQQTLASNWEQQKTRLQENLDEMSMLAQKRKTLVDEMSIRIQQKSSDYKHQLSNLTIEFSNKEEKLKKQIEMLQEEVKKFASLQTQLEDALVQIKSLEAMRSLLERRQKEAEDTIESSRTYYEGVIEHLKVQHSLENFILKYLNVTNFFKKLEEELAAAVSELKKMNEANDKLEQQIHDSQEEKILLEKKGAAMTKDLRRQLGAERKRAEKLQERLHDVLNEGSHPKTELNKSNDPETSSISSWSMMSGNCEPRDSSTRENSIIAGSVTNLNGNMNQMNHEQDLEQENYRLLSRITTLQQEKWVLEERINHLEQGSSAMAEDLMRKTQLIQYYCMERRSDPVACSSNERLSMKKFVEMFKGDEQIQESNRRMQRMLEEMLIKNMHLQTDLEQMSREVVRLSKGTDITNKSSSTNFSK